MKSISVDKKIPIQGIVPPLVTPLSARDELDRPGLNRLIDHVVNGGVSGIFILGTTGEDVVEDGAAAIDFEQRLDVPQ